MEHDPSKQRFVACLVLSAVGDALGYRNAAWEFQKSGLIIHEQFAELTGGRGMAGLEIDLSWRYSDDTVMHIATARALLDAGPGLEDIGCCLARRYKECWAYMSGRSPGKSTGKAVKILQKDGSNWNKVPFRDQAGGCGAAMRAACIGLAFYRDEPKLIKVAIEAGRITHHMPVGYLGSVVAALFTAYALKGHPIESWPARFFQSVPLAEAHIKQSGRDVALNLGEHWKYFIKQWQQYVQTRKLSLDPDQPSPGQFPQKYGVSQREKFYLKISYHGWGGSSGHDSVMIAYDALLGAKGNWNEFCLRGVLHGGDNDSTGSIGAAWFGAMYGFEGVPQKNYQKLEDVEKLRSLGAKLYAKYCS